MKRRLFILLNVYVLVSLAMFGRGVYSSTRVCWDNESSDTLRVVNILQDAYNQHKENIGQVIKEIGLGFAGTKYVGGTLEGESELLRVSLDRLDCTTFVETVIAMSRCVAQNMLSWRDFLDELENIRYRGGIMAGYGSRLHYICDWILDNGHRGNIKDVTTYSPDVSYVTKSIDFMSRNRKRYNSLSDSDAYQTILRVEDGFRQFRFPYIKTANVGRKGTQSMLKEGDILAFTSTINNLDVTHLGIVVLDEDGKWHVLHASSKNGLVEVSSDVLTDFLRKNRYWTGIRVLRVL